MRFLFFSAICIVLFIHVQMLHAQGKPRASYSGAAIESAQKTDSCPPFVDYAGQRYTTVQIGTQCWLRENLNVGVMISSRTDQTDNSLIEKYCFYDNEMRCGKYGAYYQWAEAMQYSSCSQDSASANKQYVQGICPEGWHIPTVQEFNSLSASVGGDANKLKILVAGAFGAKGDNSSGFNALSAGYRDLDGTFSSWSSRTLFWSSSEYSDSKASNLYLQSKESLIQIYVNRKNYGFHIRCLKD